MNGALFSLSLLVLLLGRGVFYYGDHQAKAEKKHAFERAGAGVAAAATFGLLLSVGGWFYQAYAVVAGGAGLLILVVITLLAALFGGFAIIRGFKHHRHSTLAIGVILGAAVALIYGDFTEIKANAGKALASAGKGITGAPAKVKAPAVTAHGHVAAHAGTSGGEILGIILLLVIAIVGIGIWARLHRQGEVRNVGAASGANALPAGGRPSFGGVNP